jgi:hypothetical protein
MAVIRVFVNDHEIFNIILYALRSAANHLTLYKTIVAMSIARVEVP